MEMRRVQQAEFEAPQATAELQDACFFWGIDPQERLCPLEETAPFAVFDTLASLPLSQLIQDRILQETSALIDALEHQKTFEDVQAVYVDPRTQLRYDLIFYGEPCPETETSNYLWVGYARLKPIVHKSEVSNPLSTGVDSPSLVDLSMDDDRQSFEEIRSYLLNTLDPTYDGAAHYPEIHGVEHTEGTPETQSVQYIRATERIEENTQLLESITQPTCVIDTHGIPRIGNKAFYRLFFCDTQSQFDAYRPLLHPLLRAICERQPLLTLYPSRSISQDYALLYCTYTAWTYTLETCVIFVPLDDTVHTQEQPTWQSTGGEQECLFVIDQDLTILDWNKAVLHQLDWNRVDPARTKFSLSCFFTPHSLQSLHALIRAFNSSNGVECVELNHAPTLTMYNAKVYAPRLWIDPFEPSHFVLHLRCIYCPVVEDTSRL